MKYNYEFIPFLIVCLLININKQLRFISLLYIGRSRRFTSYHIRIGLFDEMFQIIVLLKSIKSGLHSREFFALCRTNQIAYKNIIKLHPDDLIGIYTRAVHYCLIFPYYNELPRFHLRYIVVMFSAENKKKQISWLRNKIIMFKITFLNTQRWEERGLLFSLSLNSSLFLLIFFLGICYKLFFILCLYVFLLCFLFGLFCLFILFACLFYLFYFSNSGLFSSPFSNPINPYWNNAILNVQNSWRDTR